MKRAEAFGIAFVDGVAEGWAFGVPEAFRDQLDIHHTQYVDRARTADLRKERPKNRDGSLPIVHRMAWSRGIPPLLTLDVGHVFYDPPGAHRLVWADALSVLRRSAFVREARPDDWPGSGWVDVELCYYDDGELVRADRHQLTQAELETLLRTGRLPRGQEASPEGEPEVLEPVP